MKAESPVLFTHETLKFLRGLARHNDRDWFEVRRGVYERALRAPLLELIARVNTEVAEFAPRHVRTPAKTALRIYRDTRFSPDKRPYKRHLGAWWADSGVERTTGAGFYFQLSATEVLVAAGVFVPTAPQLLAVRRWLAENADSYRTMVQAITTSTSPPAFSEAEPEALKRVPRGFTLDHAAADLLRATRWGVHLRLPAEAALEPDFAERLSTWLRVASPPVLALAEAVRGVRERRKESADPLYSK